MTSFNEWAEKRGVCQCKTCQDTARAAWEASRAGAKHEESAFESWVRQKLVNIETLLNIREDERQRGNFPPDFGQHVYTGEVKAMQQPHAAWEASRADTELFERAYHLAVYKLAREFGTYSKARLTAMADSTMTQALEEARREQKGG